MRLTIVFKDDKEKIYDNFNNFDFMEGGKILKVILDDRSNNKDYYNMDLVASIRYMKNDLMRAK